MKAQNRKAGRERQLPLFNMPPSHHSSSLTAASSRERSAAINQRSNLRLATSIGRLVMRLTSATVQPGRLSNRRWTFM
jgi:hypothetical protein